MKKHFSGKRGHTGIGGIFFGIFVSAISVLILTLILSIFAYRSQDPTSKTGIFSIIALVFSGAVCGFAVSRFMREGGTLCTLIASFIFTGIILLTKIIGGSLSPAFILNALCYMGAGVLTSYISRPKQKRRRY